MRISMAGLTVVILEPGKLKVMDYCPNNSQPVNMERIRLTFLEIWMLCSWLVLTDIYSSIWSHIVTGVAGRALVGQVGRLVLHAMHDPDLMWGVLTIEPGTVMSAAQVSV